MNFKTKQRWKKGLTALGLIGLGYFIGRPDKLERFARTSQTSQTQYLTPTVTGTAPNIVYADRVAGQPETVRSTSPAKYGWNDFYHQEGRFSIIVPPLPVKEVTDSDGKSFSIETENEFYLFRYFDDVSGLESVSQERKQLALTEASKGFTEGFNREFFPVAQRSFALNGNPGIETHFQHRTKQVKMITRKMFAGNRMYAIAVGSPHHRYTQVFMNSFRVH